MPRIKTKDEYLTEYWGPPTSEDGMDVWRSGGIAVWHGADEFYHVGFVGHGPPPFGVEWVQRVAFPPSIDEAKAALRLPPSAYCGQEIMEELARMRSEAAADYREACWRCGTTDFIEVPIQDHAGVLCSTCHNERQAAATVVKAAPYDPPSDVTGDTNGIGLPTMPPVYAEPFSGPDWTTVEVMTAELAVGDVIRWSVPRCSIEGQVINVGPDGRKVLVKYGQRMRRYQAWFCAEDCVVLTRREDL